MENNYSKEETLKDLRKIDFGSISESVNRTSHITNYSDRSIYDSNCVTFWAPLQDDVLQGVIPNRYIVGTNGEVYNTNTGEFSGFSTHGKGYKQLSPATSNGRKTRKVHQLVQRTFAIVEGYTEEDYKKLEVNHMNSIRDDNRLENLEWVTPSENTIHAINFGNKKVFGNDVKVVLNDRDIDQIKFLYNQGYTSGQIYDQIKDRLNISLDTVKGICSGASRLAYQKAHGYKYFEDTRKSH